MTAFTLEPAAGAHGELTGLMIVKNYHSNKDKKQCRRKVLVPDAAHGTNPASASLCGYDVINYSFRPKRQCRSGAFARKPR